MQDVNDRNEQFTLDIARYIINKCTLDNKPVNNVRLQMLLYLVQKEFIKQRGFPVFKTPFVARGFGPAIPHVYYVFCGYGALKIRNTYHYLNIPNDYTEINDSVVERNYACETSDLRKEACKSGGAWDKVYQNGSGEWNSISNDLIIKEIIEAIK